MKRRRIYRVVRVTTIVEVCHVNMPTQKLAEQWAKSSDAVRTEYTTGWRADAKPTDGKTDAGEVQ